MNIDGTNLTIGGLSNDGTVNIGASSNLAIGSISLGTRGEVRIADCIGTIGVGTIGGLFGGVGSVLEIGFGSSLTLGDSLFVEGSLVD